jgi:hypothetical protein
MKLEEFIELFDNEVSRDLALKLFCEQFNCFVIPSLAYPEYLERHGACFFMYFKFIKQYKPCLTELIIKERKDLISICKFFNHEDDLYKEDNTSDLGFFINGVSKTIEAIYITGLGRNLDYVIDKPISLHDMKFGDLFFNKTHCIIRTITSSYTLIPFSSDYNNYYSMKKEDE